MLKSFEELLSAGYLTPDTYMIDWYGSLTDAFRNFGHDVDIEIGKWKEIGSARIKKYIIHEFSVDDHTGFINVYTFDDIPFIKSESVHEDMVNYSIVNDNVFKEALTFTLSLSEEENDYYEEEEIGVFSMIQTFGSAYNVMGKNLLYVEEDGTFSHIVKYWQDRDELLKDKDRAYDDMYKYKFFEIVGKYGLQRRVEYQRIVCPVGDSPKLAEELVNGSFKNDIRFITTRNEINDLYTRPSFTEKMKNVASNFENAYVYSKFFDYKTKKYYGLVVDIKDGSYVCYGYSYDGNDFMQIYFYDSIDKPYKSKERNFLANDFLKSINNHKSEIN